MGEIVIIIYWVKIFVFVRRMVLVVCSAVRVAVGVWDCYLCHHNGDHGCFYNGACGVNAPLSAVAGRVFVCVSRDNSLCINGKRTNGILQLACNGDMTTSIKVSGERSD